MGSDDVPWLTVGQQRSWRALLIGTQLLQDQLDDDLRREFDISSAEYEILVRLSETAGRTMRMAKLADSIAHSRSRVTHTIKRMEKAGLVRRQESAEDGRGVDCVMTAKGWKLLTDAAPVHVRGVHDHLVSLCSDEDFAALGRVMDAVTDGLIGNRPELDIR